MTYLPSWLPCFAPSNSDHISTPNVFFHPEKTANLSGYKQTHYRFVDTCKERLKNHTSHMCIYIFDDKSFAVFISFVKKGLVGGTDNERTPFSNLHALVGVIISRKKPYRTLYWLTDWLTDSMNSVTEHLSVKHFIISFSALPVKPMLSHTH